MNVLWNNALGNMYGPHFLVLYGILSCLIIGMALDQAKRMRETSARMPLPTTSEPDPYALAFLREGQDEVVGLAIVSLLQKGRLDIVQKSRWFGSRLEVVRARSPGPDPLTDLEQEVLRALNGEGPDSEPDWNPERLREAVRDFCNREERRLAEQSLLVPPEQRWGIFHRILPFGLLLAGLAAYKLSVAVAHGHWNVLGLIVISVVALVILWGICKPQRLTALGSQYLKELETKTKGLAWLDSDTLISTDTFLLAVSVLGLSVLESTPYESVNAFLHQQHLNRSGISAAGGCGGGCGGGQGGGCGGGCGGCGGCG